MDETMLDGNAVAGLLREVFTADMTTAIATCTQCGGTEMIGAAHAFQGAGTVLRCPHCDQTLVKIVEADSRLWIAFPGVQTLQLEIAGG
jgi:Zn finger protein HypA/HybF involved in hydrogenase expression